MTQSSSTAHLSRAIATMVNVDTKTLPQKKIYFFQNWSKLDDDGGGCGVGKEEEDKYHDGVDYNFYLWG